MSDAPATGRAGAGGQPGRELLSAAAIRKRVRALALDIERDHRGQPLHLVCVLKGAFVFLADLIRYMSSPVTIDFLAVSSYRDRAVTSGDVRLLKDLEYGLEGRAVVIVEDIVDTGLTLRYLQETLRARGPLTLSTVSLLSKPSRRLVDVPVEYVGFEIEDRFVVGYGLDYAGRYRELPGIAILE